MFTPPRCPNVRCPMHTAPQPDFFTPNGCYQPKCRPRPVPRFRCRHCRKGFSRQTFRADYRDHRPDLNAPLFTLLCAGVGLRQSSRMLGLALRCTEHKFRKIARHLRGLNRNLPGPLPATASLQFDELETYETRRSTRPLTLPMLIERDSRFVVDARSAPIRPSGTMSARRKKAIADDEERFGRRPNRSQPACRAVLRRGAALCKGHETVRLQTDEKTTYPKLARAVFGAERLQHETSSSQLPRREWNPLFPINNSEAIARDITGRLRRESWLVSKFRWFLNLQLQLFIAYRNYVRLRFNHVTETPAQALGVVDQRMQATQLLSWRQDWGQLSIHPLARNAESVAEWRSQRVA